MLQDAQLLGARFRADKWSPLVEHRARLADTIARPQQQLMDDGGHQLIAVIGIHLIQAIQRCQEQLDPLRPIGNEE